MIGVSCVRDYSIKFVTFCSCYSSQKLSLRPLSGAALLPGAPGFYPCHSVGIFPLVFS